MKLGNGEMSMSQRVAGKIAPLFFLVTLFCFSACGGASNGEQGGENAQMEENVQQRGGMQGGMQGGAQGGAQVDESRHRQSWYTPSLDGSRQIDEAIAKVRGTGKYILVQVGGDWCPWCIRLANTIVADRELREAMERNFEWIHVYYGEENWNQEAMQRLREPNKNGFPVLVLLDNGGNYVNTFTSDAFAGNDGFDRAKLLNFLTTANSASGAAANDDNDDDYDSDLDD